MKALMGDLAKIIRMDPKGREQLKTFLSDKSQTTVITLSNGKKYSISKQREVTSSDEAMA
jgi:hypothetical protein